MRVVSVELTGWRNYDHQFFRFEGNPTVLVGSNGQGKTNFVEALVYVALGQSHRTSADSVVVKNGLPHAVVKLVVEHNSREVVVDCLVTASGGNTLRLNGKPAKRKDVTRSLPLVLFAPEDLDIVRGDPETRRRFLSDVSAETSTTALADLVDYERVVRQRNSLLKDIRRTGAASTTLDSWTESLIPLATRIMLYRRNLVASLDPRSRVHYQAIAGADGELHLSLHESIPDGVSDGDVPVALREAFHVKRAAEFDRATTLVGPHRDDLRLHLNGLPVKTHSSQGEAWSCALALRLAMIDVVRENSVAGDPVVILDDVFAELDLRRRERLARHIANIDHVIITSADETTVPPALGGKTHHVQRGHIVG